MQASDTKNPCQPKTPAEILRQEISALKEDIEMHKMVIHSQHVKIATKRGQLTALLAQLDTS